MRIAFLVSRGGFGMNVYPQVPVDALSKSKLEIFGDGVRALDGEAGLESAVNRHDHLVARTMHLDGVAAEDARGLPDDVSEGPFHLRLHSGGILREDDVPPQGFDVDVDVV